MSDGSAHVSRRRFLRATMGGAAASAATGTAAAQEGTGTPDGGTATPGGDGGAGNETGGGGNETGGGAGGDAPPPDYEGWFSGTDNYDDTTEDLRGQDTATVMVGTEGNGGPNAFSPPAIHVDPGTTVQFEWTGDGVHNVVEESDEWRSGDPLQEAGVNYERTFEEAGIAKYFCEPHETNGMFGAVVVGSDYPSVDTGGGGERTPVDPTHVGVPFQPHFVGIATIVGIVVTLVFTFFQLKYGESPNTKGGNN